MLVVRQAPDRACRIGTWRKRAVKFRCPRGKHVVGCVSHGIAKLVALRKVPGAVKERVGAAVGAVKEHAVDSCVRAAREARETHPLCAWANPDVAQVGCGGRPYHLTLTRGVVEVQCVRDGEIEGLG